MSAPTDAVTIRALAPADYDAVRALWLAEATNPFTPEHLARVRAMGGCALAAEAMTAEGPCVVGVALWTHNGRQGFVWRLSVDVAHRRRGVATALLDEAERQMRAAGFESAGLLVYAHNSAATRLYAGRDWKRRDGMEVWFKALGR